jgi:3-hydroxyacyl-CoA dehydrogenase/enoyl-CoA hydratase/3-hydroxybutyryl-CoA epimerase
MPMGPLELLDQVGLDVAADVDRSQGALRGDAGPTPERLAAMARAGWCGKKSGRGFYEYRRGRRGKPTRWATATGSGQQVAGREDGASLHAADELTDRQRRLIYPMINEAAKCLEAGVVGEAWVVDVALVLGTGFAPFRGGPLRTADALGLDRVVRDLDALRGEAGDRFEPCPLLREMAAQGHGFYAEGAATGAIEREGVHR